MLPFARQLYMPRHQQGLATLTVVVLLLLILLLIVPFAIRMGVFEERTSINENRSAMVASVAEAALNQGTEFIKANTRLITSDRPGTGGFPDGWLFSANPSWEPCSVAVASTVFDPCLSEPNATRRAQMYRFNRSGNTNLPLAAQFGAENLITSVGGFNANYSVSATLCRIEPGTVAGGAPRCALTPTTDGNVAITLVSQAALPGENATAMARQVIASFKVISTPPTVPIVAASTLKGLGSAEIVPNPNSGGAGVPLSIWSNSDVDLDSGGTFATCHLGEFLTNYTSQGPEAYDGITRCPGCGCKGLTADKGLISGKDPSNTRYEGIDIMDKDNNTNGALPDTNFFPEEPFDDPNSVIDDSMFEYVMGTNTTDEGATTPRMTCVTDENPGGNCEDQFLIDIGAKEVATCAGMTAASSGLYWVSGECTLGGQVGTPSNPIFLMIDGCVTANAQMQLYGLLYMRGRNCTDSANAFKANGGGQLYGAVIVDAPVSVNGSVQFIYNEAVLQNLGNAPDFKRYGVVPGTWTDEACFDTDDTPGNCRTE